MRELIIKKCIEWGADTVGFAPISRFGEDSAVRRLMPTAKTVIGLGFRILRGTYRGVEEGSTYYQYTTMAVENMEETVMPMVSIRLSMLLEEEGYLALPQRRHQQIMSEKDSTNPEVHYNSIKRGIEGETALDFEETAVLTGLGERGLHGAILNEEYGPFFRYCFVITEMELEGTELKQPSLCDKCGKCVKACPGKAISEDGKLEPWQCAIYYNGANGTKNPFMPPYAFADFENRMDIISGNARVDRAEAEKILDNIYFYPPAHHSYVASICGRACDMACYIHLEERGVLKKKFNTPFRKREEWKFDLESFEDGK